MTLIRQYWVALLAGAVAVLVLVAAALAQSSAVSF